MSDVTTWRELIAEKLNEGEHLIAVEPDEAVLDVKFDSGYGCVEGRPFTAWSETRVFFNEVYDGEAEGVGWRLRGPVSGHGSAAEALEDKT